MSRARVAHEKRANGEAAARRGIERISSSIRSITRTARSGAPLRSEAIGTLEELPLCRGLSERVRRFRRLWRSEYESTSLPGARSSADSRQLGPNGLPAHRVEKDERALIYP